ncbi:MAG TPA: AMP-binding protein [Steroidobacteraceae bacterium]
MSENNVFSLLAAQSARQDAPFLTWRADADWRQWSYSEVSDAVNRVAAHLDLLGVRSGDRVALVLPNRCELLVAWFACAKIGALTLLLNPEATPYEFQTCLGASRIKIAIAESRNIHNILTAAPTCRALFVVEATRADLGEGTVPEGVLHPYSDLCEAVAHAITPVAGGRQPLTVVFTSGTTAFPKGVVWTHANVLNGGRRVSAALGLTQADVALVNMPLFHTLALSYQVFAAVYTGGHIVLERKFSPDSFWETSLRHGCTWAAVLPFCIKLIDHLDVPRHSYRFWVTAVRLREAEEKYSLRTVGVWGMTEAVFPRFISRVDTDAPSYSIGEPLDGNTTIVDSHGQTAARSTTGRLLLRGHRGDDVLLEYLDDPEATDRAFDADGWFDTGDLISISAEGHYFFAGRQKDVIKVGGENVATEEIELVIWDSGLVSEVAVIGREHKTLGEVPVAYVIPTSRETPIQAKVMAVCREKLSAFKIPHQIIVVREFPRSTLNKIDKAALRESAIVVAPSDSAPLPPDQERIAVIWREVLEISHVGPDEDFFSLGGHSLLATMVATAVSDAFGMEVSPEDVYAAPTIAALAAVIAEKQVAGITAAPQAHAEA